MLERSENQLVRESKLMRKIRNILIRSINIFFTTYLYLGTIYLTALIIVNFIYKSYLHIEPPFNFQLYIHNESELVSLLSIIIATLVFSGLIALLTSQRKRIRNQRMKPTKEKQGHRRRRRHSAA
ncbi:MAG TPA: hypothetical protein VJ824_10305 [Bacillota bacterium]|nr:hypothetical protein [Bacillota bacterium]